MDGFSYSQPGGSVGGSASHDHMAGSGVGGDTGSLVSGEETLGDLQLLNLYCARAIPPENNSEEAQIEAENSWEPVREWLRTRSADEVRTAAQQRGDSSMTALHLACRNSPPLDVIEVFLSIAAVTVQWPDSFGWLPIHYACACAAEREVIKSLAEAFPDSKTTVDRRGRTPLHFALGNNSKVVSPDVVVLLSSTGAAGYADDNGMLPLHYACAYGASEEALFVLTEAFPDAITTMDKLGRTPLHFALSNAGRSTAPVAVRHLLNLNNNIVNALDGGTLPLLVLAEFASTIREGDERCESVQKCLEHLLNAKPGSTATFFTALQSLPDWLSEKAVVMPVVQKVLNEKISQRFPTAVNILDLYFIVTTIAFYSINVDASLKKRYDENEEDKSIDKRWLLPLYLAGSYFLVREFIQMINLVSLMSFNIWFTDPSKLFNVVFIFVIFFWTVQMEKGTGDPIEFRYGTALSATIPWLKLLAYLRNMLIAFAVFVGGVLYVLRRLLAFIISLSIILAAFSQMFFTIFQQSEQCIVELERRQFDNFTEDLLNQVQCDEEYDGSPYCDMWNSFLHVFTMLLGEVDEGDFEDSVVGLILFLIFFFVVVIILANVLIAIVTDSYKVIQDQRAAIVFWTNRLDFVAEMDVIANGPWKQKLGWTQNSEQNYNANVFGKRGWERLVDFFKDEVEENFMSLEYLLYSLLRLFILFIVIPLWILLGVVTAGWFWPPQIREYFFKSNVFKHATETDKEDELRKTQVRQLEQEVRSMEDELVQELAMNRTQVVQMKSVIAERRVEIANEMKAVKRIMTMLFEQQSALH